MKNKLIMLIVSSVFLIFMISGCSNQSVPLDKGDSQKVEEPSEELEDSEKDTNTRKYTDAEIESMYGEDPILYDVVASLVGTEVPNVELVDKDGQIIMLYDLYKGSPYILEVMGTWCPVCEKTIAHASEFNETQETPYIFVSSDESIEDLATFVGNANIPYYVASDSDSFNEVLPLPFVPASMFIDKDGMIQMVGVGEMSLDHINDVSNKSFKDE